MKETGAEASRGEYTLKMPSYKDGRMCCEGDGCAKLNKNYIACNAIPADDECKAQDMPCTDCSCAAYAAEHGCECSPSTETCCSGGQIWNETSKICEDPCTDCSCAAYATAHACECSPSTETCCSGGQVWNDTTKSCEDQCQDLYDYIGLAEDEEADTCDGDRSGKYTCDGTFKGTCTDVYEKDLVYRSLSSRITDMFFTQSSPLLLAANTGQCAGKVYCGQQSPTTACCCPTGYYCDMSHKPSGTKYYCGTCKEGTGPADLTNDFDQMERVCEGGKVWDKDLKDCVCPDRMSWDEEKQECVLAQADIAVAVYKRAVTCCGS